MRKFSFFLFIVLLSGIFQLSSPTTSGAQDPSKKPSEYYQVNVYHLATKADLDTLDQFFKSSYIPQLHQAGLKDIGVFYPITNDTSKDKRIIVWIPLKSLKDLGKINPNRSCPRYGRLETNLMSAFVDAPHYKMPVLKGDHLSHIYELRSYESLTEDKYLQKVKMFNAGGEVKLFDRLQFNAVFYAHVIAGARMPNLIYMTSFDDITSRDAHWKTFVEDPEWKRISTLPEYLKTVSKADIILMHAAAYSDL
jgi:hypothetical protein